MFSDDEEDEKEELIISDDTFKGGNPIVKGTHVTVQQILLDLARGMSMQQIIEEYPELTPESMKAALKFAAESVRYDFVTPREPNSPTEDEPG